MAMAQQKVKLDDGDIAIFSMNGNREQRRRFFQANRKTAYKGVSWQDINNDPRVTKKKPYINEEKRANRRAYIKARRGVN